MAKLGSIKLRWVAEQQTAYALLTKFPPARPAAPTELHKQRR
jgi:hypothetical protein